MSQVPGTRSLLDHFSALEDPRQQWRVVYPLPEILLLVLGATLSGMEDFVEIQLWGKERLAFLRRFLPYERGIPSHDTLGDVINALDPELFKRCFLDWVAGLRDGAPGVIAIDGKTSRRSHARSKGREPLHLVSAWASRQRLVLGQEAVAEKANEIVAIPLLLKHLELTGALVTIDAMGTQTEIAKAITEAGGDYLLALKSDRRYPDECPFPGLAAIAMVETTTEHAGRTRHEKRYYIASARLEAKAFAAAVRAHWGIENGLHWVLDVVFHDDLARLRSGHGPENMAVVKHMAMNLIRHPKDRLSLKNRRKLACLNPDYLETLIRNQPPLT